MKLFLTETLLALLAQSLCKALVSRKAVPECNFNILMQISETETLRGKWLSPISR